MAARVPLFASAEHLPFDFSGPSPGPHALLLHGFAGTPAELRPLGEAFAAAGVGAVAPLLPGFGPAIGDLHRFRHADWLASAEAHWDAALAQPGPAILVGFSMGGALALHLAARRPPDRLVLLAPLWRMLGALWPAGFAFPIVRRVWPSIAPFRRSTFSDPRVRTFFARAAADLDIEDPSVQAALREHARLPTGALAELWHLARHAGRHARRVAVPTLVVQGDRDTIVRPADTRRLARVMAPHAALVEVATGHLLVDPNSAAWPRLRDQVVAFARGEAD